MSSPGAVSAAPWNPGSMSGASVASTSAAPISTLSGGVLGTHVPGPPASAPYSSAPPQGRSVAPWVAMGAIGLLLGAGFGVARFTNVLGSPADPSASTSQTAAPTDPKPRSVTVVILPPTATVEVEGKAATLSEGILEITGPVGSVHKVRVAAGGAEKLVRVVVSESGAVPPKIELEGVAPAAAPPATGSTPGPAVKPRPKPTTTPTEPLRNKR